MKVIFVRITGTITASEFLTVLSQQKELYIKAIVSQEVSQEGKQHLHCMIQVDSEDVQKNINQNFRNYLKKVYPELEGNKSYAIAESIREGTESKIAAYTLKEGNYVYYGFTEEEIKKFKKLSFKKVSHQDFEKERQALEDQCVMDNLSFRDFTTQYIDLLFKYRKRNTEAQIYNYLSWVDRLKTPHSRERLVNRMLENFQLEGYNF